MEKGILIKVENVGKDYLMGEISVNALQGASFDVYEEEFIAILGPSGSGKSTLLNILGGMDLPSEGKVTVKGEEINKYNDRKLTRTEG